MSSFDLESAALLNNSELIGGAVAQIYDRALSEEDTIQLKRINRTYRRDFLEPLLGSCEILDLIDKTDESNKGE